MTMKCSCAPLVGGIIERDSSPISLTASWKKQCAWTSIVLTRLPLMLTGSLCAADCARALFSNPQLQKAMPAAAIPFNNVLRTVTYSLPYFREKQECAALYSAHV